ncbi:hypothetical protein [Chryseobacterium sp.]|uniref:hypothetical protein n=1 Tax=Chryseobacterium sp. TaxID=1871047 RepID=UPI00289F401C|nr:hypothetical protein [Chryseobacterium sp.]
MSDKKKLINLVFEKAKKDLGRTKKNALANYLMYLLEEKYNCSITERTLIRYYDAYVDHQKSNSEIDIDIFKLNTFSQYLGYGNYESFANSIIGDSNILNEEKLVHSFVDEKKNSENRENIIHITIQNFIKLPEFITENKGMSMGILGVILAGAGFAKYNYPTKADVPQTLFSQPLEPKQNLISENNNSLNNLSTHENVAEENGEKQSVNSENLTKPQAFSSKAKNHMYWNGNQYILTTIHDQDPSHDVIPAKSVLVNYFKKITRTDTLTIQNAVGKTWYSKHQNKVEFFTMDGVNPENGKELHPSTEHMIEKYAGENAEKKW